METPITGHKSPQSSIELRSDPSTSVIIILNVYIFAIISNQEKQEIKKHGLTSSSYCFFTTLNNLTYTKYVRRRNLLSRENAALHRVVSIIILHRRRVYATTAWYLTTPQC